jgi:peptidoglycan/LPS O-acetylase OafA/YrhL
VRRLIPAASIVLIITIVWAFRIITTASNYERTTTLAQYATFSAANIDLIVDAENNKKHGYWDQIDTFQAPLLHYWSLSVEEQFYLIYAPLFILVGSKCTSKIRLLVMSSAAIISLLISTFVASKPVSFYSLPTRLWQMLAGCIYAHGGKAAFEKMVSVNIQTALAYLGIVAILIISCVVQIQYPGLLSTVPIMATLLLISTPPNTLLHSFLSLSELGAIGDMSYTLYLVHWPFIVLGNSWIKYDMQSVWTNWMCFLASVPVGIAIYTTVETPIRRRMKAKRGLVLSCVLAFGAFMLATFLKQPSPTPVEPCQPTNYSTLSELKTAIRTSAYISILPHGVSTDVPSFYRPEVLGANPFTTTTYTERVVLMGDSHMMALYESMITVADRRQWKLYPVTTQGCSPISLSDYITNSSRIALHSNSMVAAVASFCTSYYTKTLSQANANQFSSPDGLIITASSWVQFYFDMTEWYDAHIDVYNFFKPSWVIIINDVPAWPFSVPGCLQSSNDAMECQASLAECRSFTKSITDANQKIAQTLNATYLDIYELFCDTCTCVPIVGTTMTMNDDQHVSLQYSRAIGPALSDLFFLHGH